MQNLHNCWAKSLRCSSAYTLKRESVEKRFVPIKPVIASVYGAQVPSSSHGLAYTAAGGESLGVMELLFSHSLA